MIEFTAEHYRELCNADGVRDRIGAVEGERRKAVKTFWFRLVLGLALGAAAFASLLNAGWELVAVIVGLAFMIVTIIAAISPLMGVKEGLKHPVLEALAKSGGLEYLPSDFDPPVYGSARGLLFGSLSSQSFSDLFHGSDPEGRGYAVYEASLQRRSGKNTTTVFSGQIYALQRKSGSEAITAIVPDRKIFNFWKPASDMERVAVPEDEEFEKRFEVYSTKPLEARQLVFDSELRRTLLALREAGRVFVYVGPEEALVAASGKDRFEPGSMFRSRSGEERVKLMFDDVCASLGILRTLKAKLG